MKNKLKFLVKLSLNKKIKNKWFILANIVFILLIISLINIDNIIKVCGGDFKNQTQILVIDNIDCYDEFEDSYKSNSKYLKITSNDIKLIKYNKDIKSAKKEVKEDNNKLVLIIDKSEDNYIKASIISYDEIGVVTNTLITSILNDIKKDIIYKEYNIDNNISNLIDKSIDIEEIYISKNNKNSYEDLLMSTIIPIVILPFYLLCIFLISIIGSEINEEKTSKSMEIILSCVSPKVHLFSKIIACNLFVLLQTILLLIYAFIGLLVRVIFIGPSNILSSIPSEVTTTAGSILTNDILSNISLVLPLAIAMLIITFLCYSLLSAVLASMTAQNEDYQQLQMPLILISLIGYYLSFTTSIFKGSIFLKIMSYIPFISPILSPVLLLIGDINIYDFIISFLLMILTLIIILRYGLRIYKVGLLNYSSSSLYKKMFKAVRNKK